MIGEIIGHFTNKRILAPNLIFIRTQKGIYRKLELRDVIHVNYAGGIAYVKTHAYTYTLERSLKSVIEALPFPCFARCHRNHIVNLDYIEAFHVDTQELRVDKGYIPVGKAYRKELLQKLHVINA